ncbi:MAG: HAD family hydrolase [Candidatus Limnocylindria bacterium]
MTVDLPAPSDDRRVLPPVASARAVLFDAGDVLYRRPNRDRRLAAFLQASGLPPLTRDDPRWQELKERSYVGELAERDYHDAILDLAGVRQQEQRRHGHTILWEEERQIQFEPALRETLIFLRDAGFKLGIVTNTNVSTAEKLRWFRRVGIEGLWDSFATSCELGIAKPDPRIYRAALDPLAVGPDLAVFVGHTPSDLVGARRIGMRTVCLNGEPGDDQAADVVISRLAELPHVLLSDGQVASPP